MCCLDSRRDENLRDRRRAERTRPNDMVDSARFAWEWRGSIHRLQFGSVVKKGGAGQFAGGDVNIFLRTAGACQ